MSIFACGKEITPIQHPTVSGVITLPDNVYYGALDMRIYDRDGECYYNHLEEDGSFEYEGGRGLKSGDYFVILNNSHWHCPKTLQDLPLNGDIAHFIYDRQGKDVVFNAGFEDFNESIKEPFDVSGGGSDCSLNSMERCYHLDFDLFNFKFNTIGVKFKTCGEEPIIWSINPDVDWFKVNRLCDTLTFGEKHEVDFTINRDNLPSGTYHTILPIETEPKVIDLVFDISVEIL